MGKTKELKMESQTIKGIDNKIFLGDSLDILKTFPEKSINVCLTSPPYWGLRDYGINGQLGLEPNFNDYIKKLCDIFDEVKRVLTDDGTLWVNINDTYNSHSANSKNVGGFEGKQMKNNNKYSKAKIVMKKKGVPDKSMFMIPQRFAIEMVNRGWTLRNDIIWEKPNPCPTSTMDRFTHNYEHIFFFSKSRKYYFKTQYESTADGKSKRLKRAVWKIATSTSKYTNFAMFPESLVENVLNAACPKTGIILDCFFGCGTTGVGAIKLKRKYVGIELNNEFINIAKKRLTNLQNIKPTVSSPVSTVSCLVTGVPLVCQKCERKVWARIDGIKFNGTQYYAD